MDPHSQGGQAHDPLIGQTIGNYQVRAKLGEGGMGSVYLAEHPHIGKKVAIKLLHAEFASNQEVVQRFFNEAKAVNDIQHPNIVDIVDYGVMHRPTGEGMVYFIMEFLPGISLSELIRRESPLAPERALSIALQVADALSASHKCNIVHRDLKPDNIILISRGRERDFVKLLDFGIAKLTGDQPGSRRTRAGIVMGTPAYMSPEQCEGKSEMIDGRTDTYALGIVLYEMITGRVPFVGEGYGEVLVQHITRIPAAPSTIRGLIPPHVEAVVMKALEKPRDSRYPTMDEFMRALQDPVGYVEGHGGIGGFAQTVLVAGGVALPTISKLTPSPIASLTPPPGAMMGMPGMHAANQPTTLGASVGQVQPGGGSRVGIFVGIGVAVAAIAVGVVMLAGGGGSGDGGGQAVADPTIKDPKDPKDPDPKDPSGTKPDIDPNGKNGTTPSGTDPALPATPDAGTATAVVTPDAAAAPAAPEKITISFTTTPPGATVRFNGKKLPKKTPTSIEVDKDDSEAAVELELSGFKDEERTVALSGSRDLDVMLTKKGGRPGSASGSRPGSAPGSRPGSAPGSRPGSGPGSLGDDPMNPFD